MSLRSGEIGPGVRLLAATTAASVLVAGCTSSGQETAPLPSLSVTSTGPSPTVVPYYTPNCAAPSPTDIRVAGSLLAQPEAKALNYDYRSHTPEKTWMRQTAQLYPSKQPNTAYTSMISTERSPRWKPTCIKERSANCHSKHIWQLGAGLCSNSVLV